MSQSSIFGSFFATLGLTFVVFRILHGLVHCTINIVMLRFWLYCISTLAVWFMAGRAALSHLGS
jgi:hypothetical protein